MATHDELHLNSVIEEVSLSALHIDRSYQRVPSQQLVDNIAENWNVVASELILVSNRGERPEMDGEVPGGFWLVNGQHRTLAARKLGKAKIWARVVDLSKEDDPGAIEADLRLTTNVKLGDRPLERFKAQVRAGDSDSLEIMKILASFGTEINEKPSQDGGVNAISTVEALFLTDPTGALLKEVLEVIRDAFKAYAGRAVSANMLKSLAWFIESHGMDVDRSRLVTKLRETGLEAIHRGAVTIQSALGGSGWVNYYRRILEIYNEGLVQKNKLDYQYRGSTTFAARSRVGSSSGGSGQAGQMSPLPSGYPGAN